MGAYRFTGIAKGGVITLPQEFTNKFVEIVIQEAADSKKQPVSIGEKRRAMYGCMKGKAWVSDDFDAPLEELREYMFVREINI